MNVRRFMITGLLLSAVCASHNVQAYDDTLKPLQDKINKEFVDRHSEFVAKRAHKAKYLSKDFQEFLDNDELVLKMTQVYGDGTGEFAVKVINKKDVILKDFVNKRHKLEKENTASAKNEARAQIGALVGFIIGIAPSFAKERDLPKKARLTITAGGLIVLIGSGVLSYLSAQKQEKKQIHIAEITKMEEKWEHNFAALQKKHEVQKAADK